MKELILILLLSAASVAIASPALQHERAGTNHQQERTAVFAAWLGYVTGALVGATVASSVAMTLIPITTTAGVAVTIVSVPFLPVLAGTAVGAVVGASIGYGSVKLYQKRLTP